MSAACGCETHLIRRLADIIVAKAKEEIAGIYA